MPRVAALRVPTARLTLRTYSAVCKKQQPVLVTQQPRFASPALFRSFHLTSIRNGEAIVKVPEMAESISEGTLKQFSKQVGDYVERDEEIATIETDKIDVSVNAPEAGTIKEFLAKEEDTVTVGQELVRLETGGSAPSGDVEAKSEPKDSASEKQETTSQPEGGKESEGAKPEKKETKPEPTEEKKSTPPPQPKQESKELPKDKAAPQPPAKKEEPGQKQQPFESKKTEPQAAGSREERRVCLS